MDRATSTARFTVDMRQESTVKELRSKAEGLKRDMDRLLEQLDAEQYDSINPLGPVQGRGPDIDRLAAALHEQVKFSRELARIEEEQS